MLGKIIIGYKYNYHNLQDNQPNNLNDKLTNQSKGYQYHQTYISKNKKICNET